VDTKALAITLCLSIAAGIISSAIWDTVRHSDESGGRLRPFLSTATGVFVVLVLSVSAAQAAFPGPPSVPNSSTITPTLGIAAPHMDTPAPGASGAGAVSTSDVTSLTVAGSASASVRFPVPATGRYEVAITSGAYSPWPDDSVRQGQWRTLIDLYVDSVSWDVTGYGAGGNLTPSVKARIGFVGCDTDLDNQAAAAACGQGSATDIPLEAGHALVLMPVDVQGQYGENRGAVTLTIRYLGQ
jgi:hypothetical protein